ncbi:MAG: hypothetical protein ABI207_05465 [Crocinitomicaceae bacterium]
MTDKEKLPFYIEQLITQGKIEIEKLSKFDAQISIEHTDRIIEFKSQEFDKIESCKTLIVISFDNYQERDKIKLLEDKLDDYQKKVQFFAQDFPIEK